MIETPPCPECAQGKHGNCDRKSWSDELDRVVLCPFRYVGPAMNEADARSLLAPYLRRS